MAVISKDKNLCVSYANFIDNSQPDVYLIYERNFIFYTPSKEKALTHVNNTIACWIREEYIEIDSGFKNPDENVIFEAVFSRGEQIQIRVVKVPAMKDMGGRHKSQRPIAPGAMHFCTFQLNKEVVRVYTPFIGDSRVIQNKIIDSITEEFSNEYFWTIKFPIYHKTGKLKTMDTFYPEGERSKGVAVFEFSKIYNIFLNL